MNLIDFIGFVICFVAFVVLMFQRVIKDWRRRKYPDLVQKEEEEKEQQLKQFLKSLDMDMEEIEREESPPPPIPPND